MRESNYWMFFMEANRSKVFEIIDRRTFYIFPAVFVFCKVNILLFSSLLNMITASVGPWVSGQLVGGSMVSRFNKTQHQSQNQFQFSLGKPINFH